MPSRKPLVLLLVIVIGLFASPAALASGGTPLTKAQFVAKANTLCSAAAAQLTPELKLLKSETITPQVIAEFVAKLVPIVQEQINKTRALNPPTADRAKVANILSTDEGELGALKSNPQLMGSKKSPFAIADGLARKFGLKGAPGSSVCTK